MQTTISVWCFVLFLQLCYQIRLVQNIQNLNISADPPHNMWEYHFKLQAPPTLPVGINSVCPGLTVTM